jgi:predicted HicB family RNase H-like nuclease
MARPVYIPIERQTMKTTVLRIRKFPAELHRRIKLAATGKGKSVQEYVAEVLEQNVPAAAPKK